MAPVLNSVFNAARFVAIAQFMPPLQRSNGLFHTHPFPSGTSEPPAILPRIQPLGSEASSPGRGDPCSPTDSSGREGRRNSFKPRPGRPVKSLCSARKLHDIYNQTHSPWPLATLTDLRTAPPPSSLNRPPMTPREKE